MLNRLTLILIICLMLIATGCRKRPKGVLSDDDMVQLIADMEVAEVFIQQHGEMLYNDSARDKAVQWVLDRRGIDRADFDSTISWYGKNMDTYSNLYAKVDEELAKRQRQATGDESAIIQSGKDLWPYSRHLIMSELMNSNAITFSLPGDEIEKGDRLNLKMRTRGLQSGAVLLGVDYDNGTSSYYHTNQNGSSKIDVSLQTDTSKTVKRIFGYVRAKELNKTVWLDSISLERIALDTTLYYRIFSQRRGSLPSKRVPVKKDSIVKDEQDADLQKILSEDGGLNVEEKPRHQGSRAPSTQSNRRTAPAPLHNNKTLQTEIKR